MDYYLVLTITIKHLYRENTIKSNSPVYLGASFCRTNGCFFSTSAGLAFTMAASSIFTVSFWTCQTDNVMTVPAYTAEELTLNTGRGNSLPHATGDRAPHRSVRVHSITISEGELITFPLLPITSTNTSIAIECSRSSKILEGLKCWRRKHCIIVIWEQRRANIFNWLVLK